jgi:hypothetical protein
MDSATDRLSSCPWLFFTILGGFGYMDGDYQLIALNALTLLPSESSISLLGPFEAEAPVVKMMEASGRMHTSLLDPLSRARVVGYGYVQPREMFDNGSRALSSTVSYDHGAFVYSVTPSPNSNPDPNPKSVKAP